MYRLIFCDLDGTVSTYDGRISRRVLQAMQDVVASGRWITVSTGRSYQMLKPFLNRISINAPLVCSNGGLIVEPASREVLHVQTVPVALAMEVLALAEREALRAGAYLDDLETSLEYRPSIPGFVLRRGDALSPVADPAAALVRPPHKVIVVTASPGDAPAVIPLLAAQVGDRARVLVSSPGVIEVIVPGVSKANAMSWVAQHLGVAREETLAVGDGDNDVEMLEWAGLGVAMGNGTPAAKAAADWIAPPVEEDGLAVALSRFSLP